MTMDLSLCILTVGLAFYLRLDEFVWLKGDGFFRPDLAMLGSLCLALPIFIAFGFYRAIFRYTGLPALLTVAKAAVVYGVLYASVFAVVGVSGVPRSVGLMQPVLLLLLVGASRLVVRVWLGDRYQGIVRRMNRSKVLIYGAGNTGRQLAAAMVHSLEMQVVGYLDDDDSLQGQVLNGVAIYKPTDLSALVMRLGIKDVLLALPNVGRHRRNEVLSKIRAAQVAVRTLPSVTELAQGRVSVSDLRDLDIDDLLGREPVSPDFGLLAKNNANKVVLVTGAGGSIGSELCRQILSVPPHKLLLVEQSEFALYDIHQELQKKIEGTEIELVPLLADVRSESRMAEILCTWQPHTVYHAAAYKHVPLVEHNPAEGLRNNVRGTWVVAEQAMTHGVSDFVLISTDKAVRPTNIMGASKRLAEMVLQALAQQANQQGRAMRLSMVRFGNVLGSSGSVVPLFRQQIRNGGPITLTDERITRYFMTIPEAAQLVIQAGAMARGGDVFVLNMGESVKIIDLARKMIELSGLTLQDANYPNGDISIEVTGLRPGEKLYEELLIGDNPQPTQHARIMRANEEFLPWPVLQQRLKDLMEAVNVNDVLQMRALIQELVPGYLPEGDVVDWVHLAQTHES
jgi:FlaA1/EpsC-like NDP-sugar epimerase